MDSQNKVILKSLAEMAWADGEVTEEERALLFSICLQLGASDEEMDDLREALGRPQSAGDTDLTDVLPDKESRLNVMRVLMTMSFVDGALAFAEFDVIEKKARELGLEPEELEAIRQESLEAAKTFSQA